MLIQYDTWKQKNKLLAWGSLVFAVLVYVLAIQKTVRASARLREASVSAAERHAIGVELSQLRAREAQLHSLLSASEPMGYEPEQLATLAARSDVELRAIKSGGQYAQDRAQLVYTHYVFSGVFIQMVHLLDTLGQRPDIRPVHVGFTKKSAPNRPSELLLELVTVRVQAHEETLKNHP